MAERALATAFVNIVPGTKDLEDYLKGKLKDDVEKSGDESGKGFGGKFGAGLKGALAGIGGLFAIKEIANFTGDLIKSAEEGQRVDNTLANITKSMGLFGGATDSVVQKLQDYATAQMKATGVDDDVIKGAQAKLMTFGELGKSADEMGGAFDRATTLTLDLAAAGFGSADSAAVMLGKALNDPIGGIASLTRVGVQLSDVQKEQIQNFMAVGDVASAQNVILGEVERQVGGTAAASATASDKLKAGWDDAMQGIGTAVLPMFESITNFLNDNVLPAVEGFVGFLKDNPMVAQILAIGLGILTVAVIALTVATWAMNTALLANPITWIVLAVIALIAAIVLLVMNWDAVVKWLTDVWNGFVSWITDVMNGFVEWWNGLWAAVGKWFEDLWQGIVDWFTALINAFIETNRVIFQGLLDFFIGIGKAISDWWNGLWTGIVNFFTALFEAYQITVRTIFNAVFNFFKDVGRNISNWWNGFWTGLVSFFKDTFASIGGFVSGIFNGVANAIIDAINWVIGVVNGFIDGINAALDGVDTITGGAVKLHVNHLGLLPHLADGGLVTKPTTALIGEAGPEVVTPLRDFERMMGLNGNGPGQTIIYNAAPNESFDAEQALFTALQRAKVLAAW